MDGNSHSGGQGLRGLRSLARWQTVLGRQRRRPHFVSVIDVAAKKVVQTLDVGIKHSNRLKFTPDGKLVLVSDFGNGDLVVIDTSSHKVIKRVNLGKSAAGILIVPDGSRAYVALTAEGKVAIVDLKSFSKTGEIATGGKGPDGMGMGGTVTGVER